MELVLRSGVKVLNGSGVRLISVDFALKARQILIIEFCHEQIGMGLELAVFFQGPKAAKNPRTFYNPPQNSPGTFSEKLLNDFCRSHFCRSKIPVTKDFYK